MIENESEIARSAEDYADKAKDFPNLVKSLSDNPDLTAESEKSKVRRNRSQQLITVPGTINEPKTSATQRLYQKIIKNHRTILDGGNELVPSADLTPSGIGGFPNLSKAIQDNYYSLDSLTKQGLDNYATEKGAVVHPCLVSLGEGEHMDDYLERKPAKAGLEQIAPASKLSKESIDICEGPHPSCADCIDCRPHRDEVVKHYTKLMSADPSDNATRILSAKNLISTLESWAAHHDTKGSTEETSTINDFKQCNHEHKAMATGLRLIADNLRNALEADGVPHRDNFYGKNGDEY